MVMTHWFLTRTDPTRNINRFYIAHVPYKSLVELRAAYMPDAARAGFRVLPS
jgi:hypothetical protein